MPKHESTAQAARRWGVSRQLVSRYCLEGRIPGAEKVGRDWIVPAGAPFPQVDEKHRPVSLRAPVAKKARRRC